MTQKEKKAKRILKKLLNEQGYPTYANIFNEFDLHLTSDPGVVGYMEPGKGVITLNHGLDMSQISVIVRHEILHEYLNHTVRLLKKVNAPSTNIYDYKQQKVNPDDLTISDLMNLGYNPRQANIAGDYEISNRGYTEEDKAVARAIKLNGQELQGLVTEDQHPDWVDYTVEELYDALQQERQQQDPTPDDIDDSNDGQQGQEGQPGGEGQQGSDQSGDSSDESDSGQSGQSGDSDQQGDQEQQGQSGQQGGQQSGQTQSGNQTGKDNGQSQNGQNQQGSTQQGGGGQSGQSQNTIRGRLIDDTTFEDENGNIIRL